MWDRIASFLYEIGQLERTPRSGYALLGQPEQSVAAHTYRVAMTAWALARSDGRADVS
ncbi:MAG: HD domain-containing protein, partial [Planctomycetes bacterium]|nr:HD domain-containing protein [Planctomycetota bacterium]